MSKIFKGVMSLCAIFATVAFVGCGKEEKTSTPTPEPTNDEVKIEVGALAYDSVEINITPKSEESVY